MAEDTILSDEASASASYRVRTIGLEDLRQSVIKGLEDFNARPTHAIFIIFRVRASRAIPGIGALRIEPPAGDGPEHHLSSGVQHLSPQGGGFAD